ncbi:hypothetical protein Trydic_g8068 [Trypoxylus dichotomus]
MILTNHVKVITCDHKTYKLSGRIAIVPSTFKEESFWQSVRFGDPNFEETLMKCYKDVKNEVSDIDEVSEFDIESEHDTESKFDASKDAESNDEVVIVKTIRKKLI